MTKQKPTIEKTTQGHIIEGFKEKIKIRKTETNIIISQNNKIKMIIPIEVAKALGLVLHEIQ